jgi:3D (Asp-Asp-Asp) domain-containing protein
MAQASYDHPGYLARLLVNMGNTTAGASGTSGRMSFPTAMRIRNVSVTVAVAGTSATTGNKVDIFVGTASVGTVANGTNTAGSVGTSGDLNTLIPVGTVLALKNGTDATGVANVVAEMHIDQSGTWS